jgi:hypothetical protein
VLSPLAVFAGLASARIGTPLLLALIGVDMLAGRMVAAAPATLPKRQPGDHLRERILAKPDAKTRDIPELSFLTVDGKDHRFTGSMLEAHIHQRAVIPPSTR